MRVSSSDVAMVTVVQAPTATAERSAKWSTTSEPGIRHAQLQDRSGVLARRQPCSAARAASRKPPKGPKAGGGNNLTQTQPDAGGVPIETD